MKRKIIKLSEYLKESGFYSEFLQLLKAASYEENLKDQLIEIESNLQNYLNQIKECEEALDCDDEEYNLLIKSYDKQLSLSNSIMKMFEKAPNITKEIGEVIDRLQKFETKEGHSFFDNYPTADKFKKDIESFEFDQNTSDDSSLYNPNFQYKPCEKYIEDGNKGIIKNDDNYLSYIGCLIMNNPAPDDADFIYNIEDLKDLRGGYAVDPDVSQPDYTKSDIENNYSTLNFDQKEKLKKILNKRSKALL